MRLLLVVCAFVLAVHGSAGAQNAEQSPREYPLAETDRPLLHYAGMTVLDVSLNLPTYETTSVDAMGNSTTSTTTLGDNRDLDVVVSHSWGAVEGKLRLVGAFVIAGGIVRAGENGAVTVTVEAETPQKNMDHFYAQSARYDYKALVVPGRLAIYAGVGASTVEAAMKTSAGMTSAANQFSVSAGIAAAVQLTPRLAVSAGPGLFVPVSHSDGIEPVTTVGAASQLTLAFHRWDLYAQFGLGDLTHTPHPFAAIGCIHRWGG